jgi:ABC-2 type transport system permease protein
MRAVVVVVAVLLACLIPLWISGLVLGANAAALFLVTAVVLGTVLVWTALIALIASRQWSGALIASALVGIWCVLSLGIPLAGKYWIDSQVPRIDGAQISFIQRETVNGAWDQPKSVTMDAFYATHPQWAHSGPVTAPFHWKWYYAFQQVGDQAAADLSRQYREAIAQRDALTAAVAWISPPVAALRSMQQLASTDVASSLRYEQCIRDYHAQIRGFFYPLLFEETAFDSGLLQGFPRFDAATCAEDIRTNDP